MSAPTKREIFMEVLGAYVEVAKEVFAFQSIRLAQVDSERDQIIREYDAAPEEGRPE